MEIYHCPDTTIGIACQVMSAISMSSMSAIPPMLRLPSELLLNIAECLERQKDLSAPARTNHRLFNLLDEFRYSYNAKYFSGKAKALRWAAMIGNKRAARKSLIAVSRHMTNKRRLFHINEALGLSMQNGHAGVLRIFRVQGIKEYLTELPTSQDWALLKSQDVVEYILEGQVFIKIRKLLEFAAV